MASFFPKLEEINNLKVKPTNGELELLKKLERKFNFDSSIEIYFEPMLDGDRPDIIIMKKYVGVLIIEVKDWNLGAYNVTKDKKWRIAQSNIEVLSPIMQVENYKKHIYQLHLDGAYEKLVTDINEKNEYLGNKHYSFISCGVYFHNANKDQISTLSKIYNNKFLGLLSPDNLDKQLNTFISNVSFLKYSEKKPSQYFTDEYYEQLKMLLIPSFHEGEIGKKVPYTEKQLKLIKSEPGNKKIKGTSGSGKSTILAQRAVNSYLRPKIKYDKILILSSNKSLINHFKTKINSDQYRFQENIFYINTIYNFIPEACDTLGIKTQVLKNKNMWTVNSSLKNELDKIRDNIEPYHVVFIDDLTEISKELQNIIRKYFLVSNGNIICLKENKNSISINENDNIESTSLEIANNLVRNVDIASNNINYLYARENEEVLILTYNITLINYLKDKINNVRGDIPRNKFYIDNFHNFISKKSNELGIKNIWTKKNNTLTLNPGFEDELIRLKQIIRPYSAIFIDEIQDFPKEWQNIINKYFLIPNGEFVIFGDEKQNIYENELEDKKVVTIVPGRWNELNETHRYTNKLARLATSFQKEFFKDKYVIDYVDFKNNKQQQLELNKENIKYLYYAEKQTVSDDLFNFLFKEISKSPHPHLNDVAILSTEKEILRKLDLNIRNNKQIRTTTTFASQEDYNIIYKKYDDIAEKNFTKDLNIEVNNKNQSSKQEIEKKLRRKYDDIRDKNVKKDIKVIERNKKRHFRMNPGTLKLSTIHSFKGWEVYNLVLLITESNFKSIELTSIDELIYTGLTRCRNNLIIINIGNSKYHDFFKSKTDSIEENEDYKLLDTLERRTKFYSKLGLSAPEEPQDYGMTAEQWQEKNDIQQEHNKFVTEETRLTYSTPEYLNANEEYSNLLINLDLEDTFLTRNSFYNDLSLNATGKAEDIGMTNEEYDEMQRLQYEGSDREYSKAHEKYKNYLKNLY